jgi:hypothetical protein
MLCEMFLASDKTIIAINGPLAALLTLVMAEVHSFNLRERRRR